MVTIRKFGLLTPLLLAAVLAGQPAPAWSAPADPSSATPAAASANAAAAADAAGSESNSDLLNQQSESTPRGFAGAMVQPKPDAQVPLDLAFKDEHGKSVRLGDYFKGKPVVLAMVYYRCPMLCGLTMNGMIQGLRGVSLKAGKDYQVVLVSFDHREGPDVALAEKTKMMKVLARPQDDAGWHFLTGSADNSQLLGEKIGFGFKFNPADGEYLHQAAIYIVKPDGKISTTIGGIQFDPKMLQDSMVHASEGKLGSPLLQLALSCGLCSFDPTTGRYTAVAFRVAQVVGLLTILGLGSVVGGLLWMEKRKRRNLAAGAVEGVGAGPPPANDFR